MFVWLLNGFYQCITVDNATVQRAMIFAVSFRSPDVFILALDYCRNGTAAKLNTETQHLLTWKWRLFLIGFSWKHSAAKLVIRVCKGRISEMAWSQSRRLERWTVLRIRCFSCHVLPGGPDAPFFSKLMHPLRFGGPCMFALSLQLCTDLCGWGARCASRISFSFWCWIWFKRNIPFDHFGLFYSMPFILSTSNLDSNMLIQTY